MNSTSEQNGRLSTAEQAAPPTDPRIRVSEEQKICRDYIWGICLMGEHCRHRHELEFEAMKSVLRFCHDFQNRTGCTRADCTYLHTSREEQNLFLSTGQIPRVLADRYAATALLVNANPKPEKQMKIYVTDYNNLAAPPPPPPPTTRSAPPPINPPTLAVTGQMPAPAMAAAPAVQTNMVSAPSLSAQYPPIAPAPCPITTQIPPQISAVLPSMMMPPPPPPPPPVVNAVTRPSAPIYAAPPSQPVAIFPKISDSGSHSGLPQLPALFDPTRPPPPLPPTAQIRATKRPLNTFQEVGASKMRKECGNDSVCENCAQIEPRVEFYQHEVEKLQREAEFQRALYAKKKEEYENGIRLLNTFFNSDLFQLFNENETQGSSSAVLNDYFSSPLPTAYKNSDGSTTAARNFLLHMLNFFTNFNAGTTRNTPEHTPPPNPPLESLLRRPQPSQNADIRALWEVFLNSALSSETRASSDLSSLGRFIEGQGRSGSPRYAPLSEPPAPAPPAPMPPASAPPSYVTYPPQHATAPPPPPRPYLAQPYMPAAPTYSNSGPTMSQPLESTTALAQSMNSVNYMNRLPQQYYQPFQ